MRPNKILPSCLIILLAVASLSLTIYSQENGKSRSSHKKEIWYNYEPDTVALVGTINEGVTYGPPGYGETPKIDRVDKYFIITLEVPISVKGNQNFDTFRHVKKLALTGNSGVYTALHSIMNRKVKIKGQLYQPIIGFHPTKVMMDVKEVRQIELPDSVRF